MTTKTKIQKWGNSLAVRIPKTTMLRLGLAQGNEVKIEDHGTYILIAKLPEIKREVGKKAWEQYLVASGKEQAENVSEKIDDILYGKSY